MFCVQRTKLYLIILFTNLTQRTITALQLTGRKPNHMVILIMPLMLVYTNRNELPSTRAYALFKGLRSVSLDTALDHRVAVNKDFRRFQPNYMNRRGTISSSNVHHMPNYKTTHYEIHLQLINFIERRRRYQ